MPPSFVHLVTFCVVFVLFPSSERCFRASVLFGPLVYALHSVDIQSFWGVIFGVALHDEI